MRNRASAGEISVPGLAVLPAICVRRSGGQTFLCAVTLVPRCAARLAIGDCIDNLADGHARDEIFPLPISPS